MDLQVVSYDDVEIDNTRDAFVVVNKFWINRLGDLYGYKPPPQIQNPPSHWKEVYRFVPPKVKSLRKCLFNPVLFFRIEPDYANDLRIYYVH
jgi:hypothetical protein